MGVAAEEDASAAELWNQGGRREFDVSLASVPAALVEDLVAVLSAGLSKRDQQAMLRGRFLYEGSFDIPIQERWSQSRAPIQQPKVKFRLTPPFGTSSAVTLTIVVSFRRLARMLP